MTIAMWIATAAWLSLILAYLRRHSTRSHISFALIGLIADFALVLYLQVTRSAVQTAMEFSLGALEQIHILLSCIALLLYFPTLILGLLLLARPTASYRKAYHRSFAISALSFRSLGFLFMFSMWKSVP